ncbi:Rho guanine nucleotide exchange factor scd1 [Fusarium phyllophilum]|uniref:Rho guanine nucleotide exchange factor scd1 n=1 Tax=Fusarium phyllophilum TaxID=47803 RepID=A0A8H5IB71_9HYPO|nr:Rho guanine nucleotide exchange factor scd1 [Fusarium phyllophilum]
MSDPLSVAASIAGLISITVEAVKFLSPYVSAAKETPQVAAHVYSEVQSTQVILMGLQSLTKNLGPVNVQHAALIGVNQVVTVLTDGVLLYSELHRELQSLWAKDSVEKVPLRGRLQWVWKEITFVTLLKRLQSFKSSMTLVLMILQSDSGQTVKEHQEQLSNNVKVLLDSNDALSRRLMNIEDALDEQTIMSRRMSILSLSASPSQNTSQQSTVESPATSISTETSLSIFKFDFEDDLESSRVYRRAVRETMDFSFRSSIARSHNWSVFSGLSLGDVSVMSVIALPVYQGDLANAEQYDFGAEVSATSEQPKSMADQPLLMQCLELKLKLLTIPGMQRYFGRTPFPVDDFFDMWRGFMKATPLVILAQALSPTLSLDIKPDVELPEKTRKELVLWFAQYCHDILKIKTSELITVEDLMGDSCYGFLKTISLLSNITKNLPIAGSSSNDWSTAKAQVDSQSTELRILLAEQRQLVRDLSELLEIKDELEIYMRPMFQSFREIIDTHITFLVVMERNLLLPSTEQRWAMAFGLLDGRETEAMSHIVFSTTTTSIELWLKEGRFGDKTKIKSLLTRALEIMPTRFGRVSALFKFAKYLKGQQLISVVQEPDRDRARTLIPRIISRLQENDNSKDTEPVLQGLKERVQNWKGINADGLGELILSKTIYVTTGSRTELYHGFLFQHMLLVCQGRGEHTGEPSFYRSKSLSKEKQAKWLVKGRCILRYILSVTPTSHPDTHVCEVQCGVENGYKSKFSLVFAVESEMREWASKLDEYRMMAILMVKPQSYTEDLVLPIERNIDESVPEDLTKPMEPWKRYGLVK